MSPCQYSLRCLGVPSLVFCVAIAQADDKAKAAPKKRAPNPAMQPIFVDPASVQLQGVVVGVMRKY